jgi:hypothetical protein
MSTPPFQSPPAACPADTAARGQPENPDGLRLLACGGVLLVLTGLALGEIYAILVSHAANAVIQDSWQDAVRAAAAHDAPAVVRGFAAVADLTAKRGRYMNAHSHIGAVGLFALALATALPLFSTRARLTRLLAFALIGGGALQAAATVASYYAPSFGFIGASGAVLIASALFGFALVVLHGGALPDGAESLMRGIVSTQSSRLLVRIGLALILAGMCFGLLRAWQLYAGDERGVEAALEHGVSALVHGDEARAGASIAAFKQLQSRNALLAAAHSHAIEFGMLAVLLACLQSRIQMSEPWRVRWAYAYAIGASALPVCVSLAPTYGMRAAAVADTAGMFVMVALVALAIGLARKEKGSAGTPPAWEPAP